eukprot:11448606-Alexandrium_andersonii.AAC.1
MPESKPHRATCQSDWTGRLAKRDLGTSPTHRQLPALPRDQAGLPELSGCRCRTPAFVCPDGTQSAAGRTGRHPSAQKAATPPRGVGQQQGKLRQGWRQQQPRAHNVEARRCSRSGASQS